MDVMKKMKRAWSREDGVTLVELLAAIILLSIIVLSFIAFFTMAAKTNSRTNSVNEATFLAQEEIERVTYCSNNGYTAQEAKDGKPENLTNVDTSIVVDANTGLYKVIVTVWDGGEARAKMETVLPFAEEAETNP
ncbi:MAG: hypothetical protein GX777_10620 [Fastidiosipila sp.]|nr:hypothetical protein [Fastidiosipila sp.]